MRLVWLGLGIVGGTLLFSLLDLAWGWQEAWAASVSLGLGVALVGGWRYLTRGWWERE